MPACGQPDFNHFGGTLTVNPNGSAALNIGNGLETITDMRYDAASGRITFTRMLPNLGPQHKQVYTGRFTREGYAEGTFDCTVSGKGLPWKIERTSKAAANAQSQPSALVNLARGKHAMQSSTLSAYGGFGTADRAVDGNTNGDYFARSVTHTAEDNRPQPWWQVDLGVSSQIDHVILWNRRDCCGERLAAFWVFVSDSPFPTGDLSALLRDGRIWRYEFSGVAGPQSRIAVGKPGRYIRVQLSGRGPLSLTEVEVFGK